MPSSNGLSDCYVVATSVWDLLFILLMKQNLNIQQTPTARLKAKKIYKLSI